MSASEHFSAIDTDHLGREVAIADIDSELRAMFVDDDGLSRASLINLAIYNENPEALAANSAIVSQLTREHACRSILIIAEPNGERSAQAWVQAHCNISSTGLQFRCDGWVADEIEPRGIHNHPLDQITVKVVGPEIMIGSCLDQLRRHTYAIP